jgi:penicillin V acylase-like amidase (Ntn superfamily)
MDSVERYLEQAEFFRAVSENAPDIKARACYEYVARSYETLAESVQQLDRLTSVEDHLRKLYRPLPRGGEPK